QRLCKGDTVVWGSSANIGIYYVKGAGPQRIGVKKVAPESFVIGSSGAVDVPNRIRTLDVKLL
ncbi:MAG: hypothetical protein ACXVHW_08575, partial [Methanobacterium sp.]